MVIDENIRQLYDITEEQIHEVCQYPNIEDVTIENIRNNVAMPVARKAFQDILDVDLGLLVSAILEYDISIEELLVMKESISDSDPQYNIDYLIESFVSVRSNSIEDYIGKISGNQQDNNNNDDDEVLYFTMQYPGDDNVETISSRTIVNLLDIDVYDQLRVNSLSFSSLGVSPYDPIEVEVRGSFLEGIINHLGEDNLNKACGIRISLVIPQRDGTVEIIVSDMYSSGGGKITINKSVVYFILSSPGLVSKYFSVLALGGEKCSMWNYSDGALSGVDSVSLENVNNQVGLENLLKVSVKEGVFLMGSSDMDICEE